MTAIRAALLGILWVLPAGAQEADDVASLLGRSILDADRAQQEVEEFLTPRVPAMPDVLRRAEWELEAERIRRGVLENVVYRGEARKWREAAMGVVWAGSLKGGPGYRIRKVRFEAVPGLWVPALLYEPVPLKGKVPVHLAVNGHDRRNGKAAEYKQMRCINLAKRGMIVLNVEWIGMGQLSTPGFTHYRMNQLDLCGTSGLAPFYLTMKRGIDLLLSLEHADPDRVAVHGLSGGGWQTIFISALDPRVAFANPVAGYSSFLTRIRHHKDLGDSEQTPCDLATEADYTHLTALRAPRPTLLTYNAKDGCCFEAGYALSPLTEAAGPIYRLYGKGDALTTHVNHDPGTHNFLKDNRQALYRAIGAAFFPGDDSFSSEEIESKNEIRSKEELLVKLPPHNADFHTLAREAARLLPRSPELPGEREAVSRWNASRRLRLRELTRVRRLDARAERAGEESRGALRTVARRLRIGSFTVPAVELAPKEPKSTVLLFSESGRKGTADLARGLVSKGRRVVAFDPFYFGESKIPKRDFLFALLVGAVGERPLGIQAGQTAAIARWAREEFGAESVTVVAKGPRASLIALVAAALEDSAIGGLELHGSFGSLKEIIEKNMTVREAPELFCFGLLEAFDIRQLAALVAPRPVSFRGAGERVKAELEPLQRYYRMLGKEFDPFR